MSIKEYHSILRATCVHFHQQRIGHSHQKTEAKQGLILVGSKDRLASLLHWANCLLKLAVDAIFLKETVFQRRAVAGLAAILQSKTLSWLQPSDILSLWMELDDRQYTNGLCLPRTSLQSVVVSRRLLFRR
jgi:hypothetical protein